MANYFSDRVVQYPGRVTMTPTGSSDTYDMARAEGTVTTPGSPFNSDTFNGAIDLYAMWYGTCSTSGGTAAKVVSCSGFKLVTGATIAVKFTNAQTSTSTITLNVNGTGAKTVYGIPRSTTSNTRLDGAWEANETKFFIYDGTYWRLVDQNIITSSELSSLESELGISATASLSRLYNILNATITKVTDTRPYVKIARAAKTNITLAANSAATASVTPPTIEGYTLCDIVDGWTDGTDTTSATNSDRVVVVNHWGLGDFWVRNLASSQAKFTMNASFLYVRD